MEAVTYWQGELTNRSKGTREKYKDYFLRFCSWLGKNPDELVKQRTEDLKNDDPKIQRSIETGLKAFLAHLDQKGNAIATQQVAYAAVRSFFEMHYLPLRMRRGDYPSGESLGSRVATREDIQKLLEDSSTQFRALIMFLKDTGLRVSDVRKLKYGVVAEALERNEEIISLNLVTQKNKTIAKTFIGPEAIQALKEYFKERREGTRQIPPENITSNSPLFRVRTKNVKAPSRSGLSSIITLHAKKLGINTRFSAHSFRKFFQTQLEAAGVSPNWIDQMIGHKLINSRDSYSLPSDQQLLDSYKKAYSQLRIYEEPFKVEARIKNLEVQLKDRDRIIEVLSQNGAKKTEEINELKKKLSKIENSREALEILLQRVEELEKRIKKQG